MAADVQLFDDLDAVERDAAGALDRATRASLFDRLDWYRLVEKHTPQGETLVIRARNRGARAWLFLSVRGRHAEALFNWYSLRFGPIVDGAASGGLFSDLVLGLRRAGISRIFLKPMSQEDANCLSRALRRHGWASAFNPVSVSWQIETRGMSFDEYWASRPRRLTKGVNYRLRQGKLEFVIHDRFDEQAWQDYEAIHAASWKPAEPSPEFLREMAEREGAAGTLRLGVAYHEGEAVAAELWLVENGVASIHKSVYREDARHLAPGNILRLPLFRRALDVERVESINFGIGDYGYKADWMDRGVPLYGLSAFDLLRPAGVAALGRSLASKLVAAGGRGYARRRGADRGVRSGAD